MTDFRTRIGLRAGERMPKRLVYVVGVPQALDLPSTQAEQLDFFCSRREDLRTYAERIAMQASAARWSSRREAASCIGE